MPPVWSPTLQFSADFDLDGVYETDITADVNKLAGGQLKIVRGINWKGSYTVSQLELALDNRTGKYTPLNSASSLWGVIRPHVPIRVTAVFNAVTYTLWTGYMRDWSIQHSLPPKKSTIKVACLDLASYLGDFYPVNLTVSTTRKTSDAIQAVLAAMGLSASDYSLDTGAQSLPYHWARNSNALNAVMDAVRSEMGGFLWVNAQGQIRFEARTSRLGTSVSDTWGDGTSIVPKLASYEMKTQDLVTNVTTRAQLFSPGQANQEIFRFTRGMDSPGGADSLAIAAGGTYEVGLNYGAGVLALTTPVAVTDYLGNSAIDGTGTDKTSALTVTVTDLGAGFTLKVKNTDAATVYLTKFRLRGQQVQWVADRPQFYVSKSTPWVKVGQGVSIDIPWASDSGLLARDYAYALARTYRYSYPILKLTFDLQRNDTQCASLLAAELGQRVRYKDITRGASAGASLVDDWYYIEGIEWSAMVGQAHQVTITLVPSYTYRNLSAIAYDDFLRANGAGLGTSLSGDTWTNSSGYSISSNAAVPNATAAAVPYVDIGVTDQVVEADTKVTTLGAKAGVVHRLTDTSNYWRTLYDPNTGNVTLEKVVAGAPTTVATAAAPTKTTFQAGDAFNIGNSPTDVVLYDGGYMYVGHEKNPAKITRINLSDWSTSVLTLNAGENDCRALAVDGTYLYAACNTSPAKVVRINKAAFTRDSVCTLAAGENLCTNMTLMGGNLYMALDLNPIKVAKVNASTMTETGVVTLNAGESNMAQGTIANDGTYVYVANYNNPASVVKIDSTPARVGAVSLDATEAYCMGMVYSGGYLYVGCQLNSQPAKVVKVNGAGLTRIGVITAASDQFVASLNVLGSKLYIGLYLSPGIIYQADLTTFSSFGSKVTLPTGKDTALSIANDGTIPYVLTPGGYLMPLDILGRVSNKEIRAMVQDTRHRVWVDHKLLIDTTDSAHSSATKAGLYAIGSTTTIQDDFYSQGLN